MRLSDLAVEQDLSGCVDEVMLGQIVDVIPPAPDDKVYINRITVKTRPHQTIYILRGKGSAIEETLTDKSAIGDFWLSPSRASEIAADEMRPLQLFIPGDDICLSVTLYAQNRT